MTTQTDTFSDDNIIYSQYNENLTNINSSNDPCNDHYYEPSDNQYHNNDFTCSDDDDNSHNSDSNSSLITQDPWIIINPHQDHLQIQNKNHFLLLQEKHRSEVQSYITLDCQYIDSLNLIKLLMIKNTSFNSYNDYMKWKYDGSYNIDYYPLDKVIGMAEKRVYGKTLSKKLIPKQRSLQCPSGRRVNIITFDIDGAIFDLLSDRDLMQQSNLIFNNGTENNPFYFENKPYYDDLDQSGIYQHTFTKTIQDQSKELLTPLIIYCDETNLDTFSKLTLHPVVITLAIFNRQTRNLSMAWRPIGYLPNFDEQSCSKKYSADEKLSDFHYCFRFIIDGIEQLQKINGLDWTFEFPDYPGKKYTRTLRFPLSHIVSDAKENDKICGRVENRSTTNCLCRDCDIKIIDSDNPNIKCNFHRMSDLEQMSIENLKEISFKKIKPYNAFSKIDFGANPYGINGCTPCEPLHQINGGICERLPETFIQRLSKNQVTLLDNHVGHLCTHFSRQSDRSFPNIKPFRRGISSVAKLTANEKIGRLLAIFLTLLTSDFEKLIIDQKGRRTVDNTNVTKITKKEYNDWIHIFEDTLILTSWVYFTKHPKQVFCGGRTSLAAEKIRNFMISYKKIANRTEGMGLKILKFHQLQHLWWVIRMFSCLPNIDSGRNESHHKKKKKIGSLTQKRVEIFDIQTAKKEYLYDLFIRAMKETNIPIPAMFETKVDTQSNATSNHINHVCGSKCILTFDYLKNCITQKWLSRAKQSNQSNYPEHILQAVFNKFKWYNHGQRNYRINSVQSFTEFIVESKDKKYFLIRTCPNFRSEKDWFDWAIVEWGNEPEDNDNKFIEAQMLIFLDFSTMKLEKCHDKEDDRNMIPHDKVKFKQCAFIHSCTDTVTISKRRQCSSVSQGYITNKLCSFKSMENNYQVVDIDSITKPCTVIIDKSKGIEDTFIPGLADKIFVLENENTWHLHFIDYNNKDLMRTASNRVDNTIEIDNNRSNYKR